MTLRLRSEEPVPHVLVQTVHPVQVDAVQWMGHGPSLQGWPSRSSGHPTPPYPALVITERLRVCRPRPHETEHSLQLLKFETSQLIGQACVLHDCCAVSDGHALPPWRAAVDAVRLRLCAPVPHVVVQADQFVHADVTQSTGQAPSAHALLCASMGQT